MSEIISSAHVSGPLGQALAIVNGRTWLLEVGAKQREPNPNEIKLFFDNGLEVRAIVPHPGGPTELDQLRVLLDLEAQRFAALRGLLIGMDSDLSEMLRVSGMERAQELLKSDNVSTFVETRFLQPVDGQPWSVGTARRLASENELSRPARLYEIVESGILETLEGAVREWSATHDPGSLKGALAVSEAYETGLIAEVATAKYDQDYTRLSNLPNKAREKGWRDSLTSALTTAAGFQNIAVGRQKHARTQNRPKFAYTRQSVTDPNPYVYRAFLSYSSRDTTEAQYWHTRLETFPIHDPFRGMPTARGPVPPDIRPIFRDRVVFRAGAELSTITRQCLDESAALVLLASLGSAGSPYVAEEVRYFRHRYPERPIIPILIGPPDAAFRAMLPPSLAFLLDADGAVTTQEYNPIAADPRPGGDGLVMATAKVVGRLVGFDDHLLQKWVEDVVRRNAERTAEAEHEAQRYREQMTSQQRFEAMTTQMAGDGFAAIQAIAEFRTLLRPFHPEIDTTPVDKLASLARSILNTLRKSGADPNDFAGAVREALRQAEDYISRLDFAGAARVLDAELVHSESQARDRAALFAERSRVARLQLSYRDAAGFYWQACGAVDGIDDRTAWQYALAAANALYEQGQEFDDNPALHQAIAAYHIALGLAPRDRVPLDWAFSQHGLSNTLALLAARVLDHAHLVDALARMRDTAEVYRVSGISYLLTEAERRIAVLEAALAAWPAP